MWFSSIFISFKKKNNDEINKKKGFSKSNDYFGLAVDAKAEYYLKTKFEKRSCPR